MVHLGVLTKIMGLGDPFMRGKKQMRGMKKIRGEETRPQECDVYVREDKVTLTEED